jgi:uncharacterized membrane protein (TIGR02234 family)
MRSKGLAFGCLLAGAALALIASAQPWWRGLGDGAAVKVTGSEATGGLSQALAIVALAATLLMLALRSRGRRVVAALLLLFGVGTALTGGFWLQPRPNAVRGQLGHAGVLDDLGLTATAWPWLYALAGVLIAAAAVLTMIFAASWPNGSDRFEKGPGKVQASEDPAELWKAMDAGVDPTTDDRNTLTVADPEMRNREPGDTMDGTEQAQQLPWSPTSPNSGQVQRGFGEREA